jgi:4,5-dihydroxyphthalate decarboxylase
VIGLTTVVGPYPQTAPLKDGRVTSTQVRLEHVSIDPVNRAFRPMANQLIYDVSEMALVTLMLARAKGRPLRALPVVLMRQSAHAMLSVRKDSTLSVADLPGATVGVRAFTQTTGTWVRGILQDQFGLDVSTLNWVTFEPAHVDGFEDPPSCRRAAGATLLDMLLKGEIDAAVGLEAHPALRPLLPVESEAAWQSKMGFLPINHVLVVKDAVVQANPWLLSELYLMFTQARQRAIAEDRASPADYGLEPNRAAIERLGIYAQQQGIVPRAPSADELFEAF